MTTTKKTAMKTITFEEFGGSFHTALRKICDSTSTSLMYNVIHMAKSPAWGVLCDRVKDQVSGQSFMNHAHFADACREAWINYDRSDAVDKLQKEFKTMDSAEFRALQLSGKMMALEDWKAATAYLWEDDV